MRNTANIPATQNRQHTITILIASSVLYASKGLAMDSTRTAFCVIIWLGLGMYIDAAHTNLYSSLSLFD